MSLTRLIQGAQAYYAAAHLPERCRIERWAAGTVAPVTGLTSVPYRRAYTRPTDWAVTPGAIEGRVQPRLRFAPATDVRVQDEVVDLTDGMRYVVKGIQPAGVYGACITALAEVRT